MILWAWQGAIAIFLSYRKQAWHNGAMMDVIYTLISRFSPYLYIGRILRLLCAGFALIWAQVPATAQLPGAPLNVPANLEVETPTPAPGTTVSLAFHFKPRPTWHGYWQNPGDAGFGMQLKWTLPKGVRAGDLRYPAPEPLLISGLMNHVFEREYAVLVDLTIDPDIAPATRLPIKVRGDWLACTREICVPEGDDLSIDIVAGNGAIAKADKARFDIWRAALPVPMDAQARYAIRGGKIDIAVPYAAGAVVDQPYFFAATQNLFRYAAPQSARRTGDWLVISGGVSKGFDRQITGVLRIGDGRAVMVSAFPGGIPIGGDSIAVRGENGPAKIPLTSVNFGTILLFSVLGGLLLNLMPCVFPILGLKALALAKMGGDRRAAKRDALSYAAGVIVSCVALGGVLLILRAGGEQVGWAFQLQEPRVVLVLFLLMVAITLNLAGIFDLAGVNIGDRLARKPGAAGSFWTGVLAAIVATPCTGPFMAAALGAALLLPPIPALLLFAGLGFGLALPYLAIAFVPALQRLLPKPGPWLERFRHIMAVPMALTAAALLWLLWRLSGQFGALIGIGAAVVLCLILMLFGRSQKRGETGVVATAIGVMMVGGIFTLILPRAPVALSHSARADIVKVEAFSPQLLAQYRAQGRGVFVYFTADWCVTCKVNEAAAIQRASTRDAFAKNGIKVLEGDFTRADPEMAGILAQYGRSGVPLYLYFAKGKAALVLPQILTPNILSELGA